MSAAVWFKITTAQGVEHVGVVQGSGGKIGYSMSHLGEKVRGDEGLKRMRRYIEMVAEKRELHIYAPAPGCVALYPDYCNETDGEPVTVSLRGARVELASSRS
jgi:hypothetical protein